MKLEFELTKKDYEIFQKKYFINQLKKAKIALLIPLIIGFPFGGQPFDWMKFIITTIIAEFIYLAIFFLIPYLVSIYKIRKAISEEPGYLEKRTISISDEGIYIEKAASNITIKWESIVSVNSIDKYISFRLIDKRTYLIPKTAFGSNNEATEFLGIVQNEITKRSGLSNTSDMKKPPYKWGLICFVPIIGAYAGVVFILQGIFKYKDKWFTLMGVFGILFTVILYGTLFPELWNKKVKIEKNSELAKVWMKNLIKDIEFYKIQYGKYPESFNDLHSYSINDPTQDNNGKNTYFNYKKIGDKYLLFSSGIDGLPNTKDDIFPEIYIVDSSKIGLLKYTSKPDSTNKRTNESTIR